MLFKILINCALICIFSGKNVLTIVVNSNLKTKIYHQDTEFIPTFGNGENYLATTYQNPNIGRNYNDDTDTTTITYNHGSIMTSKIYENLLRNSNYNIDKQYQNEKLQGQPTNTNSNNQLLLDNSNYNNNNAIYVEKNIISHRTECPPGETGQFPYMYDCRRFLNCWKGRGFIQACAPGTVFNPRSLECDSPQKVNCLIGDFASSARIVEYPPNQSIPRTKIISGNLEDGAITCSPGTSGLKPHPFECNKFLNCDHGRTFIQICGPGTVFNPIMSVCDFPYNVDCGGKTISSDTVVVDSASSGSNVNYNIRENYNGNSQHNYNQYDQNRNPKQYSGHGSSHNNGYGSSYSQTSGYGTDSASAHSHNSGYGSSSASGADSASGHSHNSGYGSSLTSGADSASAHSHNSGYGSSLTSGADSASAHSHNSGYGSSSTSGVDSSSAHLHNSGYGSTLTSGADSASAHSHNSGYGSSLTSGADSTSGHLHNSGYGSSSASGFSQTNGHTNGYSQTSTYPHQSAYPHRSGHPQPHRHRNTQTTIPIWPTQATSTNYYPINNIGSTQTTTTTWNHEQQHSQSRTTRRPSSSWRGANTNDHHQTSQYQPNQTPKSVYDKPYDINQASVHEILQSNNIDNNSTTKIYYATPVEYDSDEIFGKDDTIINTSYDLRREENQQHIPFNIPLESTTTTTTTVPPVVKFQPYPTYDRRDQDRGTKQNSITTTPKTTIYYATPDEDNFGNIAGGDIPPYDPYHDNDNTDKHKTNLTKPIYPIEDNTKIEEITPPANHLLPPHLPTTTQSNVPSYQHYPNENKTNVRLYPIYPISHNNHNSTIKNYSPSVSPSYSGVSYTKTPIKPYDQPYLPYGNLQASSINNNQIKKNNPSIIFNHNDGAILNEQDADESAIFPIYVRPTRPTTIQYTTESQTKSVSPPILYNQITTSTVTNSKHGTTEHSFDVDKDTENLPISDALKLLLRPYVNKNENINDQDMKKLESHIMKIENNQAKENIKKQVEIIVTGEQEHLANRSFYEETTSHPNHQHHHHHIGQYHHHHHKQHSREFHRNHPNLPNPFENDDRESAYNIIPSTVKPKTNHPDVETVSIDRRDNFENIHVNRNPIPVDNGQKSIPVVTDCQYDCGNGKCIKNFEVCNGVNNCGNRKDEQNCDHLGYEVRLVNNSTNKHKGRIEVKVNGKWGYICDDKFDLNDANVVCRELGFPMGASEIRGNSYYLPSTDLMSSHSNVSFVMDEVDCLGNETSLRECDFKGWGVHDCNADEVVGVVCKIPIIKCPHDYWLCSTSMECIPPNFVCDNTVDCADGSDESNDVCKSKIEYRLVHGKTRLEGRLEIKYRNEWGTICDDDFGKNEAAVVCRNLGYYGPAEVIKNTYGSGNGPIWLDQVSCFGNETCLDQCTHWKWGENNCNHSEDVSIRCSIGSIYPTTIVANSGIKGKSIKDTEIDPDDDDDLDYLFYNTRSSKFLDISKPKCGYFNPDILDEDYEERQLQRITHGNVARLGRHPWQATIRVKGVHGISSHLCGAVLISRRHLLTAAHCISDYEKGAFFIRLGDQRTDRIEDNEKDVFIHDWYIHENYRKINHMNNDIALIVIKEPVQFNDYIQPICLPDENAKYEAQKMCTISGWGSDKTGQSAPSKVLRAADVPILSNDVCKQPEVYGRHITDGMFCAGFLDGKFDACDGDSGGPMACTDGNTQVLYGITSWGLRCGHENKPGVYVKISQYVEWIKRKINHSIQSRNK